MATIVVEDLSPVKKRVTCEVPEETVWDAIESQYVDIKKTAQIKGFRKGKAPLEIIRAYFRGKVEAEAIKKVIEDTLDPGLAEKNIKPLSVLIMDQAIFQTGKPFKFTAEVEVAPAITPTNYKGMKLKRPLETVTEEMVQERLQRIINLNSRLVPVPIDRGVQMGDCIIVDIKARVDGETIDSLTVDDYFMEMGHDSYLPGFDVNVEGMKIDENKEFAVDFPVDFPNKALAGKKGVFDIFCKEIKERVVPDLDDEFARDLGDYKNLEELVERVRRELEEDLKNSAQSELRQQIKDQLLANHDFEVPNALVEQTINNIVEGLMEIFFDPQVVDREMLARAGEFPREELRPVATKEAKGLLILQAIADQEGIQASEEELAQEYERLAKRLQMTPDEVKARMEYSGAKNPVRSFVIQQKAYRFLEENSVYVDDEGTTEKQPETETATT